MKIKIISTSDVHGYIYPTNYSTANDVKPYGMLKAATIIHDIKHQATDDEIVIAVENGDWIQGSSFANYIARQKADNKHAIFSEITSLIGYDAGILGNHEFNYGLDYIRTSESKRKYPILGANIDGGIKQKIVDQPYVILEQKGIKIAILGLTTQYISNWEKPKNIEGLKFNSAVEVAKKYVPKLKKLADIVVVAYHGGFEADLSTGAPTEAMTGENEGYQILKEVEGIDALITGHQHREIAGVYHDVPVTQPGEKGVAVGEIELTLNDDKKVIQKNAKLIPTAGARLFQPVRYLTAKTETEVQQWLDSPVGRVTGASLMIDDPMLARIKGHPYLDFINKVEMAATGSDIAATALFNDEVRGLGTHVTIRQILNSYGYPNTLVVEKITGTDLKLALEKSASFFAVNNGRIDISDPFKFPKVQYYNYDYYSGIEYEFDLRRPIGSRVVNLKYHNKPVENDQSLKVTLNQYRGNGGGGYGMFSNAKIIKEINVDVAELIMKYFEEHHQVKGVQPQNLNVVY